MLDQYTIYDILISEKEKKPYYFGTFEDTEDPDIEWPHRHDYFSITYFTEGYGTNVIDFKEYEIKPNRLFLMIPGQIHNWSYSSNTNGFILLLDKYYYKFENYKIPCIDIPNEYQALVKFLYCFQIEEYQKKDEITEKTILNGIKYLNSIITRIVSDNNYKATLISDDITKFMGLITENLADNISIKAYADLLQTSVDKLNDLCKSSMGITAKQLIIEQQITEAKRLLYFTTLSIKEIAFQLGFEDSSYFTRLFKSRTHSTPNTFREKVPEKQKKVL